MIKLNDYVYEIKGNLLDFPEGINAIGHCCNCKSVMGAGIAKQIKDRYPQAYRADINYPKEKTKLGNITQAKIGKDKTIYNLYGQESYGHARRHLDYNAIYNALNWMYVKEPNLHVIGLPKYMGCGLAGGEWSIVLSMISYFSKLRHTKTIIVEYTK